MIRAIAFDLDDTLLAHSRAVDTAIHALVAESGWPARADDLVLWRQLEREHYPRYVSGELDFHQQRRVRLTGFLQARGLDPSGMDLDATFEGYFARYRDRWGAMPGAESLLADLRDRGMPVGVLTNGPRWLQAAKLAHLGLAVDALVAVDDVPAGKPDPRAFHAMCAALGTPARAVAYVGDDVDADVHGAAGAGLTPVWFTPEERNDSVPGLRVARLEEVPAALGL